MGEACKGKFSEHVEDLLDDLAGPEFSLRRGDAEPIAEVAVRIVLHGDIRQVALGILVPSKHANDSDRIRDLRFRTSAYIVQLSLQVTVTHISAGETEEAPLNHRPVVNFGPSVPRPEPFHGPQHGRRDSPDGIRQLIGWGIGDEVLHFDIAGGSFFAVESGLRFPGAATAGAGGAGAKVRDGHAARGEFAIEEVGVNLWGS